MTSLFDPLKIGDLTVPNRVILAPLTRMRSTQPGNIPNAMNAQYYAQRAGGGLLITEATQVSQQGQGYPGTPGIHSKEQIAGWKLVTDAVHKAGGKIFLQLWHVGRISHSSFQPGGGLPVAPSAVTPTGGALTADGKQVPFETPRALELSEIPGIVTDFKKGAENAKAAGFDGVEVHGANGYLLDQFLEDGSNGRTDEYGGPVENRARLLLEVVDAAVSVWGSGCVGVRLSPYGASGGISDSDPIKTFSYALDQLNKRNLAYAHIIRPHSGNPGTGEDARLTELSFIASKKFREVYEGVIVSAGGYTPDVAQQDVQSGLVDAVAFGRLYIANPDLPQRIREGIALNPYDRSTFYGGAEKGYTDYPFAKQRAA